MRILRVLTMGALLLLTAPTLYAMQRERAFDDLVDESTLIITGTVSSKACRPGQQGKMIFTDVTFDDIEIIHDGNSVKKREPKPIPLSFAGGSYGGKSVRVSDVPELMEGDRYLVMVNREGMAVPSPIVGSYQGLFPLIKDVADDTWYPLTAGRRGITGLDREGEFTMTSVVEKIEKGRAFSRPSVTDTGHSMALPERVSDSSSTESTVRRSIVLERKNERLITLDEFILMIQARLKGDDQ